MESLLRDIDGHHCFWVNNGPIVNNIRHLPDVLKKMDDGQFKHHVNAKKNDFAKWVGEVIGDVKLAKSLKRVKRKASLIKKIEERIKEIK